MKKLLEKWKKWLSKKSVSIKEFVEEHKEQFAEKYVFIKKIVEKCKKCFDEKPTFWWITIVGCGLLCIASVVIAYYWLGLEKGEEAPDYRNRGFFLIAIVGAILTIWGRWLTQKQTKQTQKQIEQTQEQIELSRKANANERYEKASHMLGNSVIAVRIAGFHALRSLGIENKEMALQCIQLCLLFISTPYFNEEEKFNINEENLLKEFPPDEKLRLDIQAAIAGFSGICQHYYKKDGILELGEVDLPSYFWMNAEKARISLPNSKIIYRELKNAYLSEVNFQGSNFYSVELQGAKLREANLSKANLLDTQLEGAYLFSSNLRESVLWYSDLSDTNLVMADLSFADLYRNKLHKANLSEANLLATNLSEADLSGAKMADVKYLEKEQILSATWGYTKEEEHETEKPTPPILPEKLLKDKEIRKWLRKPHHNKFEEKRERERKIIEASKKNKGEEA